MIKRSIIFIVILSCTSFLSFSQDTYSLQEDSKISVEGGSTLTDWTAVVKSFEGSCTVLKNLVKKSLHTGKAMTDISLTCQVESMDGGRGPAMNKKIKTALKMTEHPQITFEGTSAELVSVKDKAMNTFVLKTSGDLSMAGNTQAVEIELEGKVEEDGSIALSGTKALKMSTFNIEKPSAMFGQIVTKDDITIRFELKLTKK